MLFRMSNSGNWLRWEQLTDSFSIFYHRFNIYCLMDIVEILYLRLWYFSIKFVTTIVKRLQILTRLFASWSWIGLSSIEMLFAFWLKTRKLLWMDKPFVNLHPCPQILHVFKLFLDVYSNYVSMLAAHWILRHLPPGEPWSLISYQSAFDRCYGLVLLNSLSGLLCYFSWSITSKSIKHFISLYRGTIVRWQESLPGANWPLEDWPIHKNW